MNADGIAISPNDKTPVLSGAMYLGYQKLGRGIYPSDSEAAPERGGGHIKHQGKYGDSVVCKRLLDFVYMAAR